jgi:hypothetical protein
MIFFRTNIPKIFYLLAIFFIVVSLIVGKYTIEIIASFVVLYILFGLFYREKEPPVIFAALGFQWLSITISHFYLIFFDSTQEDLLWRPEHSLDKIGETYWLSIIGLLAFSLGLKFAIRKLRIHQIDNSIIAKYDTFRLIAIYVIFSFTFDPITKAIRYEIPGIYQAAQILTYFKWSLFFLMIYISFKKNEKKQLVFGIIVFETLLGFTGYFSEFKDFLLLFPIVYLSFNKINGTKQIATLIFIALILINIGAIWSYVKVEYRFFLSGGERAQTVTVTKNEALKKLWMLTTEIDAETYQLGFESLIKRIYFLEYFSATVNNINEEEEFLEGEIWQKSIEHILMPRILFPNKEAIDDSKLTYKLTGIEVANASKGTSISTGYMAESYADFGRINMHLAIFLLGLALGLIYKTLLKNSYNQLWGFALIIPMFFLLNINGITLIKIFGNTVYFFIIFFFLKKYGIAIIDKFIRKSE